MQPSRQSIRQVLLVALLINLALAFGKLYAGWRLDCLALLADAVYSLLGAAGYIIALAAACLDTRPANEPPRSRWKFKLLTTLTVSGMLLLGCWELIGSAAQSLLLAVPPNRPVFATGGWLFLLAALGVNYALAHYQRRRAETLNSPALTVNATRGKVQVFITALTLLSLGSTKVGWLRFDAIATLVIVSVSGLTVGALVCACIAGDYAADSAPAADTRH